MYELRIKVGFCEKMKDGRSGFVIDMHPVDESKPTTLAEAMAITAIDEGLKYAMEGLAKFIANEAGNVEMTMSEGEGYETMKDRLRKEWPE